MVFSQVMTSIVDQRLFSLHMDFPEFLVGDLCNTFPQVWLVNVSFPIFSQVAIEQVVQLR